MTATKRLEAGDVENCLAAMAMGCWNLENILMKLKSQIQEKMDWKLSPLSSPLECLCRLKLTIIKNEGGKKESVQNLVKFFQFCEVILRWPKTEDRIRRCKAKCWISQPKNKLYNYLKTLIFSFICKFLTVNPNYKGRGYKSLTLVRGSRSHWVSPQSRGLKGKNTRNRDERAFGTVFNLICKWLVGILSP